jgi:hypothetical protein
MARKRHTRKYVQPHRRRKMTHTLKSALKKSSTAHHTRIKKRVRFEL